MALNFFTYADWNLFSLNVLSNLIGGIGVICVSFLVSNLIFNHRSQIKISLDPSKEKAPRLIGSYLEITSIGTGSAYVSKVIKYNTLGKRQTKIIRKVLPPNKTYPLDGVFSIGGKVIYKASWWSVRKSIRFDGDGNIITLSSKIINFAARMSKAFKNVQHQHTQLIEVSRQLHKLVKISKGTHFLVELFVVGRRVPSLWIRDISGRYDNGSPFWRSELDLPVDYFSHLVDTQLAENPKRMVLDKKYEKWYEDPHWYFELKISRAELIKIAKYLPSIHSMKKIRQFKNPKTPSDFIRSVLNSHLDESDRNNIKGMLRQNSLKTNAISAYRTPYSKRIVMECFDHTSTRFTLYKKSHVADRNGIVFKTIVDNGGSERKPRGDTETVFVSTNGLVIVQNKSNEISSVKLNSLDLKRLKDKIAHWNDW